MFNRWKKKQEIFAAPLQKFFYLDELKKGDWLAAKDIDHARVIDYEGILFNFSEKNELKTTNNFVYSICVEEDHNFLVTEDDLVVHNAGFGFVPLFGIIWNGAELSVIWPNVVSAATLFLNLIVNRKDQGNKEPDQNSEDDPGEGPMGPNKPPKKTPPENFGPCVKLKGNQGYKDKQNRSWKVDQKHDGTPSEHWDVSNKKGNKVMEVSFDGRVLWPDGPKNKGK